MFFQNIYKEMSMLFDPPSGGCRMASSFGNSNGSGGGGMKGIVDIAGLYIGGGGGMSGELGDSMRTGDGAFISTENLN